MILVVVMLAKSGDIILGETLVAFREQTAVRWRGKYARLIGTQGLVIALSRILVGIAAFIVAAGTLFHFTDDIGDIENALSLGG